MYGYSSSNFATAFKKHLNISPVDFRKKSEQLVEQSSFSHGISIDELEKSENLITVEKLDSFLVVYERKKGNYHDLPEQWCKGYDEVILIANSIVACSQWNV